MRNMGIAPFNIASSVILITPSAWHGQAVPQCKAPAMFPMKPWEKPASGRTNGRFLVPLQARVFHVPATTDTKGTCRHLSVMPISEEIQRIILRDGGALEIATGPQ